MKTTIVFDTHISGHNLEYIHHLYSQAVNDAERKFVFAIPEEFKQVKDKLEWNESANVGYHFLSKEKLIPLYNNSWCTAFHNSLVLREIVKLYNADTVILIVFAQILPFVFIFPRKVNIVGILYYIYLYKWEKINFYSKLKEIINYLSIKYTNCVKKAFVLNDEVSCKYLNSLYRTNKFQYLIDPAPNELHSTGVLSRESLNIGETDIIYLHFGSMSKRKGTIDVIKCIEYLNSKNYYVFAGKVGKDIEHEFYERINQLKKKHNIVVIDEFCSYEKIASLCKISNFLFMPYREVYQSSGLISYASMYNIPVIATNKGMLGKLIKRYKLGFTVDFSDIENACKTITQYEKIKLQISKEYVCSHTIKKFREMILSK